MSVRSHRFQIGLMVTLSVAASNGSVAAADTSDQDNGLEEITVTARLRTESLQDVPVSVTAFSSRQLEDAGVKDYGDFVALTPNVSLVEAESVGQSFLSIRGLTEVRNGEAPVAFVVDGVQQSSNRQFTQSLFDLESIQILKGPQGALYGRNASGGAIVVTTRQPTNDLQGSVQVGGGTGGEANFEGVLSGPVAKDTLLFRLAGSYTHRDGYFDNVYLGEKADRYEDETVRGLLKWLASDDLTAQLRLNYSNTNGRALNYQYQGALFDAANPCFADPANPFGGPAADPNRVSRNFCANNLGVDHRDLREATVKVDYKLPAATLTGIFSYNTVKEFTGGDQFPYTASRNLFGVLDGTQTQFFDIKSRSAEVRLTSDAASALRWMVGGYYLKTDRFISSTTGTDLALGIERVEYGPAFTSARNPTLSWFADDNNNKTWALFGNLSYDITSALELSLALRYDKDDRDQSVDPRNTGGVPPGCTATTAGNCVRTASFDRMQPKVTARYKLNDTSQVYASWGRGFRSGEFNQYGTGAAAASVGLLGVGDLVGPEYTDSYEAGYKSEFFDHHLRVDAAFFDSTVKGQQYFVFVGAVGAQVLVAIDKVEIRGGELEITANPLGGLDLSAGLGISDSKIKEYAIDPADVGKWAPYVPRVSYNLGAQYRFAVATGMRLVPRVDFISKGKQYWDPENSAPRDTVNLINMRLSLEDSQDRWALTAGVNNLTDKKYNAEFVLGGFAQPALPRVWSASFRYNF